MKIISKKTFLKEKEKYFELFKKGKVFIYPTDTIYGLGCDALNKEAVRKIIEIKERNNKPMSVIAPNKEWIKENCTIEKKANKWMKKLPGKYTLIVNLTGEKPMSSLKDLNNKVKKIVDYLIYEGKITGKPSTIVDLRNEEKVTKRD